MLPGESLTFPVLFELVLAISGTVLTIAAGAGSTCATSGSSGRPSAPSTAATSRPVRLHRRPAAALPRAADGRAADLPAASPSCRPCPSGLRPMMGPTATWLIVGFLIGANVMLARPMLGTVLGWQIFWVENSVVVIAAAVTVANLYVQGGMRVKHVAWFALVLAVVRRGLHLRLADHQRAGAALPGLAAGPGHRLPARHLQREPRTGRPAGLLTLRDRGPQGLRSPTCAARA